MAARARVGVWSGETEAGAKPSAVAPTVVTPTVVTPAALAPWGAAGAPPAGPRRRWGDLARLAAAASLAGGLALLLGPPPGETGVALAGLGALVLGARQRHREAAFQTLLGEAAEPAALVDAAGAVLAANRAMRASAPGDEGAPFLDLLAAFATAPEPLYYRLVNAALAGAPAEEETRAGDLRRRVSARAVGGGAVLWMVSTPREAPPAPAFAGAGVIETLPVALARLSPRGEIVFANAAARALLGPDARPGVVIGALVEGLGRSMDTRIAEALRGDSSGRPEIARGEPEGREVFLQVSLTRIDAEDGAGLVAVLADATELKTLEAQFVQSQKMQAVGQLAGGVAHDFNNLLTAISGHTDLLLHRHDKGDPDYADLNQIRQNANRAAGLVRQLLAFSRKQTLRPKVVNLADTLTEVSFLLRSLLGEKVKLRLEHGPDLDRVKVDERQFEQVVMNLVVNARDAMPRGGEIVIRTSNRRIRAEKRIGRAAMPRGHYVLIEVIDQGVGIPPDKIDQIFEPFYTTKKVGEGTGLGLSTVYGIVKQTGGFIFAESTVGRGATFSIYLPRCEEDEAEAPVTVRAPAVAQDLTGRGRVLLIEDEAPVRAFAARALRLRGYDVTEASSAEDALALLEDPALVVDVVVSDVVMPGMDGPTCIREARKARPDMKVVFVSGYAEESLKRGMDGLENVHFLPKPFSLNELTAKVKECVSG
jgi:two-component system cell cycle sensor histidine kinase/response regulator CckA